MWDEQNVSPNKTQLFINRDTYYNKYTYLSAIRAVHVVLWAIQDIIKNINMINNRQRSSIINPNQPNNLSYQSLISFALTRPPGHHSGHNKLPHGFSFINNIAIAAQYYIKWVKNNNSHKYQEQQENSNSTPQNNIPLFNTTIPPNNPNTPPPPNTPIINNNTPPPNIVIIDWDAHHGDGTQNLFYSRNDVLYISLHRYDYGKYFPYTGGAKQIGIGNGIGYNINIGFNISGGGVGGNNNNIISNNSNSINNSNSNNTNNTINDIQLIYCFNRVIVPILLDYKPNLILISAGFDSAKGDPIGGMNITQKGYVKVLKILKNIQYQGNNSNSNNMNSNSMNSNWRDQNISDQNNSKNRNNKDNKNSIPILLVLEGGYNVNVLKQCVNAICQEGCKSNQNNNNSYNVNENINQNINQNSNQNNNQNNNTTYNINQNSNQNNSNIIPNQICINAVNQTLKYVSPFWKRLKL